MKHLTFVFAILATIFCMSCSSFKKTPIASQHVALVDFTDSTNQVPRYEDFLSLWQMDPNIYAGQVVEFAAITDVVVTTRHRIRLESVNPMLANRYERQKEITAFKEAVQYEIEQCKEQRGSKNNSTIWPVICRELDRMKYSDAKINVLTIYSDLKSNDHLMNYYDIHDRKLLREQPQILIERLKAYQELPNLEGIHIQFRHTPANLEESRDYESMKTVITSVLEPKGAMMLDGMIIDNKIASYAKK